MMIISTEMPIKEYWRIGLPTALASIFAMAFALGKQKLTEDHRRKLALLFGFSIAVVTIFAISSALVGERDFWRNFSLPFGLPEAVAIILVVSFELGRRKRLRDELSAARVVTSAYAKFREGADREGLSKIYESILGRKFDKQILNDAYTRNVGRFSHSLFIETGKRLYSDVKINDRGRVTYLSLHISTNGAYNFSDLVLPAEIASLEELRHLYVTRGVSLPFRSLSTLPNLQHLILTCNPEQLLSDSSFWDMELPHVTNLTITFHDKIEFDWLFAFFQWILQKVPRLERFTLQNRRRRNESPLAWDKTRTRRLPLDCVHHSLTYIKLDFLDINEDNLVTLLFDMLPPFPRLEKLDLANNKVQSLKPVHQRLLNNDNSTATPFCSKIKLLDLLIYNNPVMYQYYNLEEVDALCGILRSCNTIAYLPPVGRTTPVHPQVNYELLLNMAGRCLVEHGRHSKPIPLSLWPRVLARIGKLNGHRISRWEAHSKPTALFYLLRNGPVLNRNHSVSNGTSYSETIRKFVSNWYCTAPRSKTVLGPNE